MTKKLLVESFDPVLRQWVSNGIWTLIHETPDRYQVRRYAPFEQTIVVPKVSETVRSRQCFDA